MASLVLAVGAAALSSAVGLTAAAAAGSIAASIGVAAIGAAASIVGSIIDSYLFAPHTTQEGPRLNELQVQGSREGAAIPEVWGLARLSGQIIWGTRLLEVITTETENVGGKGGGGTNVTTTTYTYFISLAVGVCKEVTDWKRIRADGKLAYREATAVDEDVTASTIAFFAASFLGDDDNAFLQMPTATYAANIPSLDVGVTFTVTGASTGGNNQQYTCVEVTEVGSNIKIFVEETIIAEAAGASVTISLDEVGALDHLTSPRFYNGTPSQTVDSKIEAVQGTGNAPAYRGVAYCVLEEAALERFGNRIPSLVFEVENEPQWQP